MRKHATLPTVGGEVIRADDEVQATRLVSLLFLDPIGFDNPSSSCFNIQYCPAA